MLASLQVNALTNPDYLPGRAPDMTEQAGCSQPAQFSTHNRS